MRTQRIDIKVSLLDKTLIRLQAKEAGMSVSAYMVSCSLHREIKSRPSEALVTTYQELSRYQVNFRQISSLIRDRQPLEVLKAVEEVATRLNEHLKLIRDGQ